MNDNFKTLGDIPKIRRNIRIWDKRFIKALHFFIYHESGGRDRRARIRVFSGFHFSANDEKFEDKVEVISKVLSTSDLVSICAILDIPTDSKDLIRHIFNHLIAGSLLEYDPRSDSDGVCGDDGRKVEITENTSDVNKQKDKNQGSKCFGEELEKSGDLHEDEPDLKESSNKENPIFKSISDFVKPFRGCNDYPVESWVKDFEDAASTLQLKDWQKFVLAKNSLKGLAKSLVEERGIYKWEELKTVLVNEFRSKMSGKALHEALKGRTMKSDESIFEYYKQMKIIANQGTLGDLDLIDYIIQGTPDDPWKVVLYGAKSSDHFREKLKDYDFLAKGHERMRSFGTGASGRKTEKEGDEKSTSSTVIPEQDNLGSLKCKNPEHTPIIYREKPSGLACSKFHCCAHMSSDCASETEDLKFVRENFNGLPKKEVFLKGKRLYAMIDSGSQLNLINTASHRRIGSPTLKTTMLFLRGFGRAKVPPEGYFEDVVQIDGYSFNTRFYVVGDDILKRDVIIGSTLLQEAEFTFRRNEILIRKVENAGQCNTNSSAKNKESSPLPSQCTCAGRKTEPSIAHKPEEIAKNDEGSNQDCNLQRVVSEQQTVTSDLENAIINEKDKALEYQKKFRSSEEYFTNVGQVNNQVNHGITDRAETDKIPEFTAKIPEFTAKLKNNKITKVIHVEEDNNENECKLMVEENEHMDELKKKCAILEKSLIELTKDCNRLRKENKSVVNLLSEEKLKRKKLLDKLRDGRPLKKGEIEQICCK